MNQTALTFRRYEDGDDSYKRLMDQIVIAGESLKCPTYVHRTPPCQGACPSGHDVRGWLNIVRGLDKPADGMTWQEYAFRNMTEANPFPALMGRVCPAPCEKKCNRAEVEDHVGINSVEHYIGNHAIEQGWTFAKPLKETGKKVAIVGGGPAGLSCAYQLRRMGHMATIFEEHQELGGMLRYGLPNHRLPRDVIDAEIQRIIDLGVEVEFNTRVGTDITVDDLERDFDAVFWGIGAQSGKPLNVPGGDAPNCITGLSFLRAYNQGRLRYLSGRTLVIGGGDTAMDVASVARRIGSVSDIEDEDRPENVIRRQTIQDVVAVAKRLGSVAGNGGEGHPEDAIAGKSAQNDIDAAQRRDADVMIVYRRPMSRAPATMEEIQSVIVEGVEWRESLAPVSVVKGEDGRAKALRVVPVDWIDNKEMVPREGEEFDIECSLIVGATGQAGDFTGFEEFDNGNGLMGSDGMFQVAGRPGHFVGGDAINPDLLTTAIGHAWKAAEGIDRYIRGQEPAPRKKVDVHHFDILESLHRADLDPETYDHLSTFGTCDAKFAVHNYEDRSAIDIISAQQLFLSYFEPTPRHRRREVEIDAADIIGNQQERLVALSEEDTVAEAGRCMSCGICIECDNCVIYCPQDAVFRVKSDQRAMGRYVDTDYSKCIGCHICMDVCATGFIQMGLGE